MTSYHLPVMAETVVKLFSHCPNGCIVDATVGTGGHAEAILLSNDSIHVVGIDRDSSVLELCRVRLERFGNRIKLIQGRFSQIERLLGEIGVGSSQAAGILLDLGLNSLQVDTPGRGFSYMVDGPLDMRMDATQGIAASDLVNEATEDELVELFRANGEYQNARRVSRAIIASRPLHSTTQLVDVIDRAVSGSARKRKGHVAKRFFQAMRVYVNEEQAELATVLDASMRLLSDGGYLITISYHSGEDGMIKAFMRYAETGGCQCPPQLPCRCGAVSLGRMVFRGVRKPTRDEIDNNPRAKSAKLRAFERVISATGEREGREL